MNSGFYNPYIAGRALNDESDQFFGRQKDLEGIEAALGARGLSLLVLFGQRRIGKTSLLLKLQNSLSKDAFFSVYFDLQDQVRRPQRLVLYDLASSMLRQGKERSIHLKLELFDNEGAHFRDEFLKKFLITLEQNQRLVFLFDEFEALGEYEAEKLTEESAGRLFFQNLRQILSLSPKIAAVIVVGRHWDDLSRDYTALFKGAIKQDLWVLDETSAEDLIRQAERDGSLSFGDDAIKKILNITSRHPYLLQLICQRIWHNAYLNKPNDIPVIGVDDVNRTIPDVIEMGGAFQWWWDGLSPAERICAAAMAEKLNESVVLSEEEVATILNDVTPRLRTPEITFAPRDLVKRKVLMLGDETTYSFSIDLFRRWIKQNKSLRLVKDELDSLYGVAHYLFQTGENYFRKGEINKASEFFEKALEEDPRHFRARLYLGRALLDTGRELDAINALEEAYRLDHEESQNFLILALLTSARQLRNSQIPNAEENIIKACERVLVISKENKDALEMLAEIWNRRGEIAVGEQAWATAVVAFQNARNEIRVGEIKLIQEEEKIAEQLLKDADRAIIANDWYRASMYLEQLNNRELNFSRRAEFEKFSTRAKLMQDKFERSRSNVHVSRFVTRTRPTLVIGLGGSGQWVLTFLKKELLESGGGKFPDGVELINIDTVALNAQVGSLELDRQKESVIVGNNLRSFAESSTKREENSLGWFPSEIFLRQLSSASFNTREGTGQIRQLGRLSLFHDITFSSVTMKNIERALFSLASQAGNIPIQIVVVSSMSGGTGAGMLTDIGLLIQQITVERNIPKYTLSGYLFLPTAFGQQDTDGLSRAFATWRELDRFMLSSETFASAPINYASGKQMKVKPTRPVFDIAYLIEPITQEEKPEEDLFPKVANAIYTILDQKAGNTQYISRVNLSTQFAPTHRTPYYSVLGAYTMKYSEYLVRRKYALRIITEALSRLTGNSSAQHVSRSDVGRGIEDFLQELRQKDGQSDNFLSQLVYRRENIGNNEQRLLDSQQLKYFVSIPYNHNKDDAEELIRQLNLDFSEKNNPKLKTESDWSTEDFSRDVRHFKVIKQTHCGYPSFRDGPGLAACGDLGKLLESAKVDYVELFRAGLQQWSNRVLNDAIKDPRNQIFTNLSDFQHTVDELLHILNTFRESVQFSRDFAVRIAKYEKALQNVQSAQFRYESVAKDKRFFILDYPRRWSASRAQLDYISAEQKLIENIREEIFLRFLAELSAGLSNIIEAMRRELGRWIQYLSPPIAKNATDDTGILVRIASDEIIKAERERINARYTRYIGEREPIPAAPLIDIFMQNFSWETVIMDNGDTELRCGIKPIDEDKVRFMDHGSGRETSGDLLLRHSYQNLEVLQSVAESLFDSREEKSTLRDELIREFPVPNQLASFLTDRASPWFRPAAASRGPGLVTEAVYLGGQQPDRQDIRYFEFFESTLKSMRVGVKSDSLEIYEMADPYRLLIYRADHLLSGQDFATWEECRRAYWQWIEQNPNKSLHIFPEEENAEYYERLILRLLGVRRILNPRIVTLLNDQRKFELFFHAFNLGFIQSESESGQAFWSYQGTSDLEPVYLTIPSQTLELLGDSRNVLQVIHNFVVLGRDQRPIGVNPINWERIQNDVRLKEQELGSKGLLALLNHSQARIIELIRRSYRDLLDSSAQERSQSILKAEEEDLISLVMAIYNKFKGESVVDPR